MLGYIMLGGTFLLAVTSISLDWPTDGPLILFHIWLAVVWLDYRRKDK